MGKDNTKPSELCRYHGCRRLRTPGLSRLKKPFTTCKECRERYQLRVMIKRHEKDLNSPHKRKALWARCALEAIIEEARMDPALCEYIPEKYRES